MSKKHKLTAEDAAIINDFSSKFEAALEALDRARQLNLGDYLILRIMNFDGDMVTQTNCYGAPVKYTVVHVTPRGMPFVKKVNKKGNPVGQLYSCIGFLETDDYKHEGQKFQFELDPDFADSILLQDNYDPSVLHKSKRAIWKEVTDHNKKCKIDTHDIANIVSFFKGLSIGDTIWTSNKSHYTVQDIKLMNKADVTKIIRSVPHHRIKGPHVIVLTVVNKKGQVSDIAADFFYYKALYKDRPRSYNELKI